MHFCLLFEIAYLYEGREINQIRLHLSICIEIEREIVKERETVNCHENKRKSESERVKERNIDNSLHPNRVGVIDTSSNFVVEIQFLN